VTASYAFVRFIAPFHLQAKRGTLLDPSRKKRRRVNANPFSDYPAAPRNENSHFKQEQLETLGCNESKRSEKFNRSSGNYCRDR
jgi:hypothetical protein